ncbi:thioredoxin domain-containing protein [bacterium]|nr:thioredoxin domain-containing protein [bacterium]
MKNKLVNENSPYLLQHSSNPVNWFPWGEEAFRVAKDKDLPVFLSIGYSTCHWCHVMEKESFEDEEVALILNKNFISIKVDREQRPDLDSIYMSVCQMMTKRGGWPLTVILTPDKIPFFAGTYFPKNSTKGSVGLCEFLPKVREVWDEKREDVLKSCDSIYTSLKEVSNPNVPDSYVQKEDLKEIFESIKDFYDEKYGGFGEAPKFPSPQNMIFLSKFYKSFNEKDAMRMVEQTLTSMRLGGIFDHVGFGFHRYSTDIKWLVPHFEKMLYDQGMILESLAEAYSLSFKDLFRETSEEIYLYVNEVLKSKDGGFFSAEDADSEGQEGAFYTWELEEIRGILTKDESAFFEHLYGIEQEGNFNEEVSSARNGKNIIYLKDELETFSSIFSIDHKSIKEESDRIKQKLKIARNKRIRPSLDDKILTDWNSLMISALSKSSIVFRQEKYLSLAINSFEFIINNMVKKDSTLFHCIRDNNASIEGMIDDYAFLTKACVDLYEATLDPTILETGLKICEKMIELFWDNNKGLFYATPESSLDVIVRQKNLLDGAIPSGNSVALFGLIKIGGYCNNLLISEKANKLSLQLGEMAKKFPINLSQFLANHLTLLSDSVQIVIVNPCKELDFSNEIINYLRDFNHNNKLIYYISTLDDLDKYKKILRNHDNFLPDISDKFGIYICKDYCCNLPVRTLSEVKRILD